MGGIFRRSPVQTTDPDDVRVSVVVDVGPQDGLPDTRGPGPQPFCHPFGRQAAVRPHVLRTHSATAGAFARRPPPHDEQVLAPADGSFFLKQHRRPLIRWIL
jgi:hypothetical protein